MDQQFAVPHFHVTPKSVPLSTNNRLLRTNIVAERLRVSERDVRYLAQTGRLPAHKRGVRLWFFYSADVDRFKSSREHIKSDRSL